jgi:HlyD family secretion protein
MKPATLCSRPTRERWLWAALIAVATLSSCSKDDPADSARPALATVVRGPMQVTVTEGGSLASARPVKIVNEMEGRATILFLVKEGSHVNAGDVVVRLDSADVRDKINDFEVRVEQETAALKQAEERHAIQLNQNESDITVAELESQFAKTDYDKYMNGDYPQKKKKLESDLVIAQEELKRALDRAVWSKRLEEKKFITRTELEADELAAKKREIEVELAKNALKVLDEFEFTKESKKLQSDRDEKEKELVRVKRRAVAEAAKTLSDVNSRKRTLELAQSRLKRVETQLLKSEIKAPSSGTVVYAREERGRMSSSEPVSEGKQLHEREEILQIPDTRRMIVQLDIHESLVKKVKPGLQASIRLDAIAGRQFNGRVRSVSSVPSTSNQWMNPDLKVYPTEVEIEEELEDLKPGMNAHVEILVADLQDVLQVPMQSIHQSGGKAYAYVDRNGNPEVAPVELGLNNDRAVVVKAGLNEGDKVYLALPPGAPNLPAPEGRKPRPPEESPTAEAAGEAGAAGGNGPSDAASPGRPTQPGGQNPGGPGPGVGGGRRPRGDRPPRPKDP